MEAKSTTRLSLYQGAIHFVNPKGGVLFGRPVYPSVAQAPDPLDLAVVLIPAQAVPQALRECGERGLRAAIIASGGFRETGEAGARLEAECLRVAQAYGMRLIGPNCIGLLDTHLPLDTTFLSPPGPVPGDVAFISQSGAICAAAIDWARGQGFGLSRLVSLGNQLDVTETETLAPVAEDPHTKVLALYLEGVGAGRRFVEEASCVARKKPVVALKVGRYASGRRAVASHTGALAGQENAYRAAFRRAGVIRADSSEEMFDWARALAWCKPPMGRSVAVLTLAGGPAVAAADAIEASGLELAHFTEDTRRQLAALLPPAAALNNPVDMLATASPGQYAACLRLLLADPGVHSVLVIVLPPPMHSAGEIAKAIIPIIYTAEKPVVVALIGERLIQEAVELFRAVRVPEYRYPERAVSALAVLAQRAEFLHDLTGQEAVFPQDRPADLSPETVRLILEKADPGFLPAESVNAILAAYGIPTPPSELARTAAEAVALARKFGFPVALKVASPDIVHKSDVGGVLLNLGNEAAVREGFAAVTSQARRARPEAAILGVTVQSMLPPGQEVIVGAVQDAQFGPLLMFGSGGVEVESLKDVEFALAPLTPREADYLLEHTWAGRKLRGFRHLPPADRQAVFDVLLRLGQLSADFPQLTEIEINPLRVMMAGQGAVAVDARMSYRLQVEG